MQTVKELLEDATKRREKLVEEINGLAMRRQELIQEALRLDGEIRVLTNLSNNGEKEK